MHGPSGNHERELHAIARQAMRDRDLEPDFPPEAVQQVERFTGPARAPDTSLLDLRDLPWASIDNDDSRDLDQLTVAQELDGGDVRVLVAIADVDALVRKNSPVDVHARRNTTSVYTAGGIFPMLPERLSTDLTSLNPSEDREAMVTSYVVRSDGAIDQPDVYRALVRNHAKLAYSGVGPWLDGTGAAPPALAAAPGVPEQMRLQDAVAERLRRLRHEHGALQLQTIEAKAVLSEGLVVDMVEQDKNRAHELIEDFMIAANGVTTRFLEAHGLPTFRRVVRSPERWDRIEELAAGYGERLPRDPDAAALAGFLARRRKADPLRFPDLSLTVIKLLGAGEYAVHVPGEAATGHFGLAVRDYSHSTAPNRRYPDVITQRLLKLALNSGGAAYGPDELSALAQHCTEQEDNAKKVERQVRKSAAALLLSDRIGERFDAICTGASNKGTWVRVLKPPVEGKLVQDAKGVDVGDRLVVRLAEVDVERGFIDFTPSGR